MENTASKTLGKSEPDGQEDLAALVRSLQSNLQQMETFIKRRFDEISMEINATSQQIDMSEEGMAERFGEILGAMGAISYSGNGSTPANTGVELEAVITETTKAANEILDCSDRMNALLYPNDPTLWNSPESREKALESLRENVQNIMLACSFQDIAGQRIRKTLESLNEIEDRISSTLESMGLEMEAAESAVQSEHDLTKSGNSQADIDALFG